MNNVKRDPLAEFEWKMSSKNVDNSFLLKILEHFLKNPNYTKMRKKNGILKCLDGKTPLINISIEQKFFENCVKTLNSLLGLPFSSTVSFRHTRVKFSFSFKASNL